MDTKGFIDDMLRSAKTLSTKGRGMAEERLGIPDEGNQRDAMLDGLGKGALAGGALALLLGTGIGRRLTGSAIKLGGLAAVGAVAYKAYQHWQGDQAGDPGTPIGELPPSPAETRSETLLEAMIVAALADGHVDAAERAHVEQKLRELGLERDIEGFIQDHVARPRSLTDLAAKADSPEAAAEIYLVSRLVIDTGNPSERQYLDQLSDVLALDPGLRTELDHQVQA